MLLMRAYLWKKDIHINWSASIDGTGAMQKKKKSFSSFFGVILFFWYYFERCRALGVIWCFAGVIWLKNCETQHPLLGNT